MTTNAAIGHGNLFQMMAGSPLSWTTLAEVTNVTPPAFTRDAQEATHSESPEGWKEYIPGRKDAPEISCELNFIPDSDTTDIVLAQFDSNEPTQFRVLFADGDQDASPPTCSSYTVFGIVTGFTPAAPLDDKMTATLTLKPTGKPTFVRASA